MTAKIEDIPILTESETFVHSAKAKAVYNETINETMDWTNKSHRNPMLFIVADFDWYCSPLLSWIDLNNTFKVRVNKAGFQDKFFDTPDETTFKWI